MREFLQVCALIGLIISAFLIGGYHQKTTDFSTQTEIIKAARLQEAKEWFSEIEYVAKHCSMRNNVTFYDPENKINQVHFHAGCFKNEY